MNRGIRDRAIRLPGFMLGAFLLRGGSLAPESLVVSAALGACAFVADHTLRSCFGQATAAIAAVAWLVSIPSPADVTPLRGVLVLALGLLMFAWAIRSPSLGRAAVVSVAILTATVIHGSVADWRSVGLDNLLVGLWSSRGLLYGGPLLWLGTLGLIGWHRSQPRAAGVCAAAIASGLISLVLDTETSDLLVRTGLALPFFLPGLARAFEKLTQRSVTSPKRVVTAAGGLLILWNLLFMRQYGRLRIPTDDTVSFAEVTSNSGDIVSRGVGTPVAWPANWIFARRFSVSPHAWDAVAGRRLFPAADATTAVVEFGDDEALSATDLALLANGFSQRQPCGDGWCRDVYREGRLLLPLQNPGKSLRVSLRASGRSRIALSIAGIETTANLNPEMQEVVIMVPASSLVPGINVLHLRVLEGGRARVDRLTLERSFGPS